MRPPSAGILLTLLSGGVPLTETMFVSAKEFVTADEHPTGVKPLGHYHTENDPWGPIVYQDRSSKPKVRVLIHWYDGSVDEEVYNSPTEGKMRYQNLRALLDDGLTYNVKDVTMEVIG